jgi:short-subunit dehydrogenase
MSLANKAILISGANRGIGAAVVRALLKTQVSKIYAAARNVNSLPNFGDGRVVPLELDVTKSESVARAAATANDVDVLINNAGTMGFGDPLQASDTADLDMQTNFFGTLRVVQAFVPQMTQRGSGTIANVVSIVGLAPVPILASYSASKAALQSLTQSLRGTLSKTGIKVLGIYPGPIDTDLAKGLPLQKTSPEHAAENIVKGIDKGDIYIFPDPMSLQIEHLWAKDGRQLETALQVGG